MGLPISQGLREEVLSIIDGSMINGIVFLKHMNLNITIDFLFELEV
jgi:hypothetical protein